MLPSVYVPWLRIALAVLLFGVTNACQELTPNTLADPLNKESTIFMASADHTFYALNALTGGQLWQATTQEIILSSPVVSQGLVYALSDHQVYALNMQTGYLKWTFSVPDRSINTRSTLVVREDQVYFVGGNGHQLYALDAQTGNQIWRVVTPSNEVVYGIPAVADHQVYVGLSSNRVQTLDAQTGHTRQIFSVGAGQQGIYGAPLVANGKLYVGSYDGNLYALDAATGQQQWLSRLGGWLVNVDLVGQTLYVTSWQEVFALEVQTGGIQWRFKPAISGYTSTPSLQGSSLYGLYTPLDSPQAGLFSLDAGTGSKQWEHWAWPGDLNSNAARVIAANGLIYVAGSHHQLYALDGATGETKWTFSTSSGITCSPYVN